MSDARVKSNHGPGRHILVAGYQGISTVVIYCDDINTPYSHPYTSQGRDSRTHNHLPDCTNLSKPLLQLPHLAFIHRIFPTYTKDPISPIQRQKTALIKSITSKWHPKSSQIPSQHLMRIDHFLLRRIWKRRMIIRILSRYVLSAAYDRATKADLQGRAAISKV
jgi:hypothetical protein